MLAKAFSRVVQGLADSSLASQLLHGGQGSRGFSVGAGLPAKAFSRVVQGLADSSLASQLLHGGQGSRGFSVGAGLPAKAFSRVVQGLAGSSLASQLLQGVAGQAPDAGDVGGAFAQQARGFAAGLFQAHGA
ncbi:uncharacterized protein PST29_3463 [Pseudomonas sp. St29]|nr:uncharacterized protein PST29_3463 [Pseudomonas sp. St29]